MNYRYITFLLLLILTGCLLGCSSLQSKKQEVGDIAEVSFEQIFAPGILPIKLESTDQDLISAVNRVCIARNGKLLVGCNLLKSTASIFLFSPNGKFLRQIGKRGQGPGEYNFVNDIAITTDNDLILAESGRYQLFSMKGKPQTLLKNGVVPIRIFPSWNGLLVVRLFGKVDGPDNSVIQLDRFGRISDSLLPQEPLLREGIPLYLPFQVADATDKYLTLLYCYRMGFRRVSLSGPSPQILDVRFREDSCSQNRATRKYLNSVEPDKINEAKFARMSQQMVRFEFVFDFGDQLILINSRDKSIYSLEMPNLKCKRVPVNLWKSTNVTGVKITGMGFVGRTKNALICVCDDYKYVNQHYQSFGFKQTPELTSLSNPILFMLKLKR